MPPDTPAHFHHATHFPFVKSAPSKHSPAITGRERGSGARRTRAPLNINILQTWCLVLLLCATAALLTPHHALADNTGLVGHWSFNEGTGTVATDFSGNGNFGTTTGGPTWTNGKLGKALEFTNNRYVGVGNVSALDVISAGTVSAWIYINDYTGFPMLVSKFNWANDTNGYALALNAFGDQLDVGVADATTYEDVQGNTELQLNRWYHVAMTWDGTTIRGYVNGAQDGSISQGGITPTPQTQNFNIARGDGVAPNFQGKIDEVRIYSRALTAAEVLKLYQSGATLSKPPNNLGLVGYWSFDEGTSTIATDFSGNGNAGTLTTTGAALPTWVNGKRAKALNFDGDDYVTAGNINALESGDMSFAQWVRFDALAGTPRWVVQQWTADTGPAFFTGTSNELVFQIGENGPGSISTVTTLTTGRWYHLVATAQGTTLTIYIDGVQAAQGTVTRVESGASEPFNMGDGAGGVSALTGAMDEVRIYNRALGASEVAKLYGSGAVKFTTSSVNLQQGSTLADGLVGLWTFDGADVSDRVYDRSGNNNNGYFVGGATSSAKVIGKLGQALNFDGSSSYVTLGTPASLDLPGAMSICTWVNFDSLPPTDNTVTFVGNNNGGSDAQYSFQIMEFDGDDNLAFVWFSGSGIEQYHQSLNIDPNNWYHFCGVRESASSVVLYQNGESLGAGIQFGDVSIPATQPAATTIGKNSDSGNEFDGRLDDVRIYNRALSPAEVQQLFKLGTVRITQ